MTRALHRRRAVALLLLGGCAPDFSDATSIVSAPRLLAVQSTPPEGPTGAHFALQALYVGADGAVDGGGIAWATCLLQKPLGDPGSVTPACLGDASAGLAPLGDGLTAHGAIPANACELFGPSSPPPLAGQPSARPTDPDSTGGFYLPIRVLASGTSSIVSERIACQPSGVSESVFTAFTAGYVANQNPAVLALSRVASDGGVTTIPPTSSSEKVSVAPGSVVSLRVEWPTCPTTAAACHGAETYVLIDPTTSTLTTARESIVASWYASGGSFALDRVGRALDDPATNVTNTWTAPAATGPVRLWVVLRDARGGVGWESYLIDVGP